MKELFKDKIKNDELKNLGFTTINYLDNSQVKELEAFYLKNTKTFFSGFHPTMFHDNLEYRKQVNNKISLIAIVLILYKYAIYTRTTEHSNKNNLLPIG